MKKTFKTIINIALGFGTLLVFNESDHFFWNLLGIACFACLLWLNSQTDLEHTSER